MIEISTLPSFAVSPVELLAWEYERFQRDMIALTILLRHAKKVIAMDGYVSLPAMRALEDIAKKRAYFIRKNLKTNKKVEIYMTKNGAEPNLKGEVTAKGYMNQVVKDISLTEENQGLMVMAFALQEKG